MPIRAAVLTVSDKASTGDRVDTAGPAVVNLLESIGADVVHAAVIPDDRDGISAQLRTWADEAEVNLILTTGGTGLGPRDVTPEATLAVSDRLVPGIAEWMRQAGRESTPLSSLSRSVAVARANALIVNLPGSERGARESLEAVLDLLPHAVDLLQGDASETHPVDGA